MKLKSGIAVILSFILMIGIFAGCTQQAGDKSTEMSTAATQSMSAAQETEANEPPMQISIGFWDLEGFDGNDAYGDKIEKDLNIEIKPIKWVWGKHRDMLELRAMSNDLPDIWGSYAINTIELPRFYSWIDQGLIRSIPEDLINKYPTIKSYFENSPTAQAVKTIKGAYYMIPRPDTTKMTAKWQTLYYRKDWMANVGITEVPDTVDEFYALLKAYKNDDPDKNGKNDTYGLAMDNAVSFTDFLGIWGVVPECYTKENGKWIPGFISEKNIPGLQFLQKLYREGLLDPEFTSNNAKAVQQKFVSGTFGSIFRNANEGTLVSVIKNAFGPAYKDIADPLDAVGLLPPLKADEKSDPAWVPYVSIGTSEINAKVDDKKLDKILQLLEYTVSKDNENFINYGFEGEDYDLVDGQPVIRLNPDGSGIILIKKYPSLSIKVLGSFAYSFDSTTVITPDIKNRKEEGYVELGNWRMDQYNAVAMNANLNVRLLSTPAKNEFPITYHTDFMQMIIGKEDIAAAFPAYVKAKMAEGLDKVIEEVNAAAK